MSVKLTTHGSRWGLRVGASTVVKNLLPLSTDITEYNDWVKYIFSQASHMDSMGVLVLHLSLELHLAILATL